QKPAHGNKQERSIGPCNQKINADMVEHPQKRLDGRILYGVIDGGRRIEKQNRCTKNAAAKDGHTCSVYNRKSNQERNGHYTQQNSYAMSNTVGKFLLKRLWSFYFSGQFSIKI